MFRIVGLGLIYVIALITCQSPDDTISYNRDIRPIFNENCLKCHGGVKAQGGFSLLFEEDAFSPTESGEVAIVPGNLQKSPLYHRLVHHDPEMRMPLHAEPLDQEEIDLIARWIDEGAHWELHWAYEAPDPNIEPPAVDDGGWSQNGVDTFIYANLAQNDLLPESQADPVELVRRLYLDLIGLPPTLDEARSFLQNPDDHAYDALVDKLLASPHFGEHWAVMWLDLARYADSKGYEKDSNRSIWKYRDWLITALNEDMPFDQFTIEQLAGDMLEDPSRDQLIATAFHRNSVANDEGGTDDEEFRVASIIERLGATYEVWMSTTFACVQCHSHPYDPFRQEEYYESMAIFNNSADKDLYNEQPKLYMYESTDTHEVESLISWINAKLPSEQRSHSEREWYEQRNQLLDNLDWRRIEAEEYQASSDLIELIWPDQQVLWQVQDSSWVLHEDIDLTGVSEVVFRCATALDLGGYISLHPDSLNAPEIARLAITRTGEWDGWGGTTPKEDDLWKDFSAELTPVNGVHDLYLRFWMGDTYIQHLFYVDHFTLLQESTPEDRYGLAFQDNLESLYQVPAITTPIMLELTGEDQRITRFYERGSWLQPTDTMRPALPAVFAGQYPNPVRDRLDFAQWLVSADNPLVARVLVNRIWERIFGYGIVKSMEEFGSQGDPPTHPGMLDWLAIRVQTDYKWSLKELIKTLVMSNSYRQSSKVSSKKLELDPDNLWLSRGVRTRLSAEQIRDQILAVSGLLDRKIGGPSVILPELDMPERFIPWWAITGSNALYRRSMYTFWRRTDPFPTMITFDSPDRMICSSQRIPTNTPLQALNLLNDTTYYRAAEALASQVIAVDATIDEEITSAYQRIYLRPPGKEQVLLFKELYDAADESANAQAIPIANRPKIPQEDTDLHGMTMVVSAMMNLDAFVVKE